MGEQPPMRGINKNLKTLPGTTEALRHLEKLENMGCVHFLFHPMDGPGLLDNALFFSL
jgi:hypothetical protein